MLGDALGDLGVGLVQLDEDTPDEVTVEVDAETGDVVRTEQGD